MYQIKDSELLERDARVPLLKHDRSKYIVQEVEVLSQLLCYTISPFFHNFRAPILEYPPSLELFEERKLANPLELVALSEPASQRKDLRGLVIREDEQALSRDGVVLRILCFVEGLLL